MGFSKTRWYLPKDFAAGEIAAALQRFVNKYALEPGQVRFRVSQTLPDGTSSSKSVAPSELDDICDLTQYGLSADFTATNNEYAALTIGAHKDEFSIMISSDTAVQLAEMYRDIGEALKLQEQPSPLERVQQQIEKIDTTPLSQRIAEHVKTELASVLEENVLATLPEISDRLRRLEEAVFQPSRMLRCFMSYRFTNDTELVSLRIQHFLGLLDIEVLTGSTYEPRRVTEKVLARLREPLDFIVVLVTASGESMWTRDEVAWAHPLQIPVIPLVEIGAHFEQGLFGDIEYIEYSPGHIGDTFLKLLEAVHFIRRQRATLGAS